MHPPLKHLAEEPTMHPPLKHLAEDTKTLGGRTYYASYNLMSE
jgi:hypothetical protein